MEFLGAISGWQWAVAVGVPLGLIALYFLKLKRKPLQVPSTYLWKKSIEDLHVNSLWQRLRRSLLLFLQLLAAAAVLLAFLRPTVHATGSGKPYILLIDNSASMRAVDVSPSRLEAAKVKALQLVDQMGGDDAGMVVAFSDTARVVCSYTTNTAAIKQAIRSIEPTDRRTDPHEALAIASGLANPQKAGEEDAAAVEAALYMLSDGEFAPAGDVSLGNLSLHYIALGSSGKNVGLTALSCRPLEKEPNRLQVFARVRNFFNQPIECTAELQVDGQQVDLQRLSLPAEDEQSMAFRLSGESSAVVSVRLEVDDDLAVDDQAWTVVEPPRPAKVLVVGDPDALLKSALATPSMKKIAEVSYEPKSYADRELAEDVRTNRFDLVIFDRCVPKSMPSTNAWCIGAVPAPMKDLPRTPCEGPVILNWKSNHPILRFLNLDDVNITDGFTVAWPRGADPLLETDKGTLLAAVPRGVFTDLVQTFPIVDDKAAWKTDWPLRLSFPLYVMNVIRTLGQTNPSEDRPIQPGDPASFRGGPSSAKATVQTPDGRSVSVTRSPNGSFEFLDTERLGVYAADVGDAKRRFAVNLFDEAESRIAPEAKIEIGAVAAEDASRLVASRRELWRPIALAAFAILMLEWYIYNRRMYL